jgi:hypothetical protein
LLWECAASKRTTLELAVAANVPRRLVVEALINLLRANWLEVRSEGGKVSFAATPSGKKRAGEKNLPERLQRDVRWDAVCVDRVTGHWMRADDLDLIHEKDLPLEIDRMDPLLFTFEPYDAALRDLFRLGMDESLEPAPPQFRPPSMHYARISIAFGEIESGLPPGTPLSLKNALMTEAGDDEGEELDPRPIRSSAEALARDDITPDDIIVGGPEHRTMLTDILESARSTVVIHSCFISANTIRELLPELERAAKRKVRVELLWGLHTDPESEENPKKFSDALAVLSELPPGARAKISLSPDSSGSHAKVIVYDDHKTGKWTTVVGSCNYLSSDFDWLEVSLRTRSGTIAASVLGKLLSVQLPAVGQWSGTARRLNAAWSEAKHVARSAGETGTHVITLTTDRDHYSCITHARDRAQNDIEIVCDLYGLAAETSVLVPMETAAKRGVKVSLGYTRPSRFLLAERTSPVKLEIAKRGIDLTLLHEVHGKYIGWDDDGIAISSFNWMAASVSGTISRNTEIGVMVEGPAIRVMLKEKTQALIKTDHVAEGSTPN